MTLRERPEFKLPFLSRPAFGSGQLLTNADNIGGHNKTGTSGRSREAHNNRPEGVDKHRRAHRAAGPAAAVCSYQNRFAWGCGPRESSNDLSGRLAPVD